jgi:hypothetical protein
VASQVIDNTIYVWYGFIPIPVKTEVFAVTVTVMEMHTHGIPVKYPTLAGVQVSLLAQVILFAESWAECIV